MQVTEVEVRLGLTQNLGDYSNVKPEVVIRASLAEGDDAVAVLDALSGIAREQVREEADLALEAVGKRPVFWRGEKFVLLTLDDERLAAVVPWAERATIIPNGWGAMYRGFRLVTLWEVVGQYFTGWQVIDCSDGDMIRLPVVVEAGLVYADGPGLWVLVPRREFPRGTGWDWSSRKTLMGTVGFVMRQAAMLTAEHPDWPVFDCLDGDWSQIPVRLDAVDDDADEDEDDLDEEEDDDAEIDF